MERYYTNDRGTQMLIGLMKAHGIKKIVISPGTTNISLVGSVQNDPYFELFSSVDERSAAYMACGLAAESGEPVALSCTGATASRNYLPGLTEAFYRKLPVLAITSMESIGRVGHLFPQTIDRSQVPNDIAKLSIMITPIHTEEDEWIANVNINKALLELTRDGGGPVHINLTSILNLDYSTKTLPSVRSIHRICMGQPLPELIGKRIAIFVGAHKKFCQSLTAAVDTFCAAYNAVVLCDHTSNYKGKFRILMNLVCDQVMYDAACKHVDILIHIGNISGAYASIQPAQVWRVNRDGEVRDYFKTLQYVFEMDELLFFQSYVKKGEGDSIEKDHYLLEWKQEQKQMTERIPELPFSNIWMAGMLAQRLPQKSVLILGILNSLRSWNLFEIDESIYGYANTGGFGIDGCISTTLGASLASPDKLFFCITGDLGFFYDMNACGNHHWGNNVRILLVNNGKGTEFRNYSHPAEQFGEEADRFMAAAGHFGHQSRDFVRHYAMDLGFEYLSAATKEEFVAVCDKFVSAEKSNKPIIFETFTHSKEESVALYRMQHLVTTQTAEMKEIAKNILGKKGVKIAKKLIGREQ